MTIVSTTTQYLAMYKLTGLKDGQSLHHFLRDATWQVEQLRAIRLYLI
ncbi:hypothetical protein H6F86_10355 [Phormidium sp. FACHB-592]|uniref:Transposase n=1 Tax=Stenomitos frigidus AS-A4 TaxID=2933935 RepID=A0ABV0KPW2_9CYAN|nr:hypothetical protein [Phormidium sp. FACHB-592]MBD2074284.1 hypothetical protein [Phormidium sp. FACHB-592]